MSEPTNSAETVRRKCSKCYGYGMWGIGEPCAIGPMDAKGGMPTIECPECGANRNPLEGKNERTN